MGHNTVKISNYLSHDIANPVKQKTETHNLPPYEQTEKYIVELAHKEHGISYNYEKAHLTLC